MGLGGPIWAGRVNIGPLNAVTAGTGDRMPGAGATAAKNLTSLLNKRFARIIWLSGRLSILNEAAGRVRSQSESGDRGDACHTLSGGIKCKFDNGRLDERPLNIERIAFVTSSEYN